SRAKTGHQDEERSIPLRRSRSVEARQKTPGGRMKRQDSETGPSALPNHLNQVTAAFTAAVETRSSQVTTLQRCVHGISLMLGVLFSLLSELPSTENSQRIQRPSPVSGRTSAPEARPTLSESAMGVLKDKKWKRPQDLPNAIRYDWEQDMDNAGLRTILNTPVLKEPVKVDFEDKQAKYHVAIHFAPHYHALRHWICGDDLNFVRSLQHCNPIQTSGGKSRATFLMSHDKRFLLKAINESEFKKLNSEAENLFWYFDKVLFDKWPSVLTQVIGLFSVSATKKSQNYKGYYVVQQNLRYSLRGTWAFIFDLKGTGKNRRVQAT
ncbi:Pikfyve, partial [Symbiodinium necroappetens]